MSNLYVAILAGGSGTRLWPRSRTSHPKPYLDLIGDRTMVQETVRRIEPLVPPERTYFIVGRPHAALLREQVPQIPPQNILVEPAAKGTGPCVGLAALHIARTDPDATMTSLHADHFIGDEEGFREALRASHALAQRKLLVTMGATPTYAETGYGYIHRGETLAPADGHATFAIARFVEKPDRESAERMVASGEYYWNTGMFTWRVDTIRAAFAEHMPGFSTQLDAIAAAPDLLDAVWAEVKNETIDRGIMERAANAAVVPIDIGWSDIGSWASVHDLLPADADGNVARGGLHLAIDTRGTLVQSSGKVVATIGVSDLIVVETDDAILVCTKERAQDVKQIVETLRDRRREELV